MVQTDEKIGPYVIISPLGLGRKGFVFEAQHQNTGEKVALKKIILSEKNKLNCLRREIFALSKLRHPGIVRIIDQGLHDRLPWYAMEFLDGLPLRHYLGNASLEVSATFQKRSVSEEDKVPLAQTISNDVWWTTKLQQMKVDGGTDSIRSRSQVKSGVSKAVARHELFSEFDEKDRFIEMLSIFRRLCSLLSFLHGEGIIHRDLKPENIIVLPDGMPVLVDFGFMPWQAKLTAEEALSSIYKRSGTLSYISPEQIRGETLDARTDLYALGCMLYEFCTARLPFYGEQASQLIHAHLTQSPVPPQKINKSLPRELNNLIMGLLSKNRYDRIGHADLVSIVLERLGAKNGVTVPGFELRGYVYHPRFVGRERELLALQSAVDGLSNGVGSFFLIRGEIGVGKTRLIHEFIQLLKDKKLSVLSGEAYKKSAYPFQILQNPLHEIVDYCIEQGRAEAERIIGQRGENLSHYFSCFSKFHQQSWNQEFVNPDTKQSRYLLFRSLLDIITAFSEKQPVIMYLDDIQWADDISIEFIDFLLNNNVLKTFPISIIMAVRSEESTHKIDRPGGGQSFRVLELDSLNLGSVAAIVSDMLCLTPPPQIFSEYLLRKSGGNPFFIIEYLRTAVGDGILWRDIYGNWQVAEPGTQSATKADYLALAIPDTLPELLRLRLSDLSPDVLELVTVAAVLGREVEFAFLQFVVDLNDKRFFDALDDLYRRQILDCSMNHLFRFSHNMVREIAYGQISPEKIPEIHQKIAEKMDKYYHNTLAFRKFQLDYHREQARL